jgi:hypothetical protein
MILMLEFEEKLKINVVKVGKNGKKIKVGKRCDKST